VLILYRGVGLDLYLITLGFGLTCLGLALALVDARRDRQLIESMVSEGMSRRIARAQVLRRRPYRRFALMMLAMSLVWMKEFAFIVLPGAPPAIAELFGQRRLMAAVCLPIFVVLGAAIVMTTSWVYNNRIKEKPS
jgi:hypothetical protein